MASGDGLPTASPPGSGGHESEDLDDLTGFNRFPAGEPDPSNLSVVGENVSCENCEHFGVCAIYAGFAPMLADWPMGEPPVDPRHLAAICVAYEPVEDDGS
jgi:hypothetical protein